MYILHTCSVIWMRFGFGSLHLTSTPTPPHLPTLSAKQNALDAAGDIHVPRGQEVGSEYGVYGVWV